MMIRSWRHLATVICSVVLVTTSIPSVLSQNSPANPYFRTDKPDSRLEKQYSVQARQAYVGELLEALSKESGVLLTTDSRDIVADHEVTVYVAGKPLRAIMEGLRSLFSNRKAEWFWIQRESPQGAVTYSLERSQAAKVLSKLLRDEIQRRFEKGTEQEIQWLDASPEERKKLEAENPDLKMIMEGEGLRAGMSLFAAHLDADARKRVLRGQERIMIPVESLSATEKGWVDGIWFKSFDESQRQAYPYPDKLDVSASRLRNRNSSNLLIGVGKAGAYSYAGGRPAHERNGKMLEDLWRPPDEAIPADISAREIPADKTDPPVRPPATREEARAAARTAKPRRLDSYLQTVAARARVDIVSEYRVDDLNMSLVPPIGQTVGSWFQEVYENVNFMSKQLDGIVLVRDRAWCLNSPDEGYVPWQSVREWRTSLSRHNGIPTLKEVRPLMSLNQLQSERIRAEFQEIGFASSPVFAFWTKLPTLHARMAEGAGLPLNGIKPDVLAILGDTVTLPEISSRPPMFQVSGREIIVAGGGDVNPSGLMVEARIRRPPDPEYYNGFLIERRTKEQWESPLIVKAVGIPKAN